MNKIKKLHRYVHGLTKDEKPFLFLDFFHLEIDETGKIVNGEVSVMIFYPNRTKIRELLTRTISFWTK